MSPIPLTNTFVKLSQNDRSICDVKLLFITEDLVGLVTDVASNSWSSHFQNFGSVAVTGSPYMARTLLFLSFGSIYAADISNLRNNSQSYFCKFTSVLVISSNQTLNSLGFLPPSISHSTAAQVTTASLVNFLMVRLVLPMVSHMA